MREIPFFLQTRVSMNFSRSEQVEPIATNGERAKEDAPREFHVT